MSQLHWFALNRLSSIGGVTARLLLDRFGSVEALFAADPEALLRIPRFGTDLARLRSLSLDTLEAELALLADQGVRVLTWEDADYPVNLRSVHDAPPVLFVQGAPRPSDADAVAIVGTRQPSPRGLAVAVHLARELAGRGLTVVSGLAIGIDTAAHRGALQARGGRTLAVLGSGLRTIHPQRNVSLARAIASRGVLLSEVYPDTPVSAQGLMARNRIIAGLSRAVIVVEAGEKSGSLRAADRARCQGRLVYVVPGSPGPDRLLAEGAERLVSEATSLDALCERIRSFRIPEHRDRGPLQPTLWSARECSG